MRVVSFRRIGLGRPAAADGLHGLDGAAERTGETTPAGERVWVENKDMA